MTRAHSRYGWTTLAGRSGPGAYSARCQQAGTAFRCARPPDREQIKAAPGIEPTTTKPVHLWKIPTRIVRFHVSSRHVPVGGSLTITGVLQQYAKHWLAPARQVVWIVLQPNGSQTWHYIRKPRTTASGHFSATFADPGNATWS